MNNGALVTGLLLIDVSMRIPVLSLTSSTLSSLLIVGTSLYNNFDNDYLNVASKEHWTHPNPR